MRSAQTDVTLLLVEDDDIDAFGIQRSFKKQRIANTIIRAHDGLEALEIIRGNNLPRPFVILLDLQMPRMTGLEFLKELRSDPELAGTVVFILTTSSSPKDLAASYEQKVAGYFLKDKAGENFVDVVTALDSYWKVAQFPA